MLGVLCNKVDLPVCLYSFLEYTLTCAAQYISSAQLRAGMIGRMHERCIIWPGQSQWLKTLHLGETGMGCEGRRVYFHFKIIKFLGNWL